MKMEELTGLYNLIEEKWKNFQANQDDEKFVKKEIKNLLQLTLFANLDFRNVIVPNAIINEQKERIRGIISSLKDDISSIPIVNYVKEFKHWSGAIDYNLLSGKLVGHITEKFNKMERILLQEDDLIAQVRMDALMQLFEISNDEKVTKMILNVLETYRKLLIRETDIQNKISSLTMQKLLKYNMIILCQRKQYEHLYSMIKMYPQYRKILFVFETLNNTSKNNKARICELHIAAACIQDLLRCEFKKGRLKQDIHFFHLYLSHLIDLATKDKAIGDNLEKIILSATDMDVLSDYYYLAATLIRIKMQNVDTKINNLAMKLISIGLSHDISYLEEVKFSKSSETIPTHEGEVERQTEFTLVYYRMYLALITLATIIPDYKLQRFCFDVASVCEPMTNNCEKILERLPPCDYNDYDITTMDPVLLNIRYQLETFYYDSKHKVKLAGTFNIRSNKSYEYLEYFNRRMKFDKELSPLEYPGVEKYLKKQNTEDTEHVSQVSNLTKCLNDNKEFNEKLSSRLKKLQDLFITKDPTTKYPSQNEVFEMIKDILLQSSNFYITKENVFTDLGSMSFQNILTNINNNLQHWLEYKKKRQDANEENLLFDWKEDDECGDNSDLTGVDVDEMYQKGVIKVTKLLRKGYRVIDIENTLLFAILEKKMKFFGEKFAYLNKNRNVDVDNNNSSDGNEVQHNQIHAGFLYIINRQHPEYTRLQRLTFTVKRFYHVFEYYHATYVFDGTPGKYRFIKNDKTYKMKQNIAGISWKSPQNPEIPTATTNIVKNEDSETRTTLSFPSYQEYATKVKEDILNDLKMVNGKPKSKPKPKNVKAPTIPSDASTFFASDEICNVFLKLQRELTLLCGKNVKIDINKITDTNSPHLIYATTINKSSFPLNVQKIRNSLVDPRNYIHDIELPLVASGKLTLVIEFRDIIEYDEFNDNPKVKSTQTMRIEGTVLLEKLSHNVKFDIECTVESYASSRIKCIFQANKARPPAKKKPIAKVEINTTLAVPPEQQVNNSVSQQQPITVMEIKDEKIKDKSVISNSTCVKKNNYQVYSATLLIRNHQQNYPQQNNIYLPPFNSIAPSTSQYMQQPVITQYSSPSTYSNNTTNYSANIQPPPITSAITVPVTTTIQYNNSNNVDTNHQKDEVLQSNESCVKPRVEILKIEKITPPKNATETTINNVQVTKKLSFGVAPIHPQAVNCNEKKIVDYEDDLESIIKSSLIPVVNKAINLTENVKTPLHENVVVTPKPVSVIQSTPSKSLKNSDDPTVTFKAQENLQKSPPPLLHFLKNNNVSNNDVRPLTKGVQKYVPMMTESVIKNGKSPKVETIDLTDEIEQIDLTNDSSIRHEMAHKRKISRDPFDFSFVSCSNNEPIVEFANVNSFKSTVIRGGFLNGTNNRMNNMAIKSNLKRSIEIEDGEESSGDENIRNVKIRVVDVMENLKQSQCFKKNSKIKLSSVKLNEIPKISHYVAQVVSTEEEPIEEYVENFYDANFTIVGFNSVSYYFKSHSLYGDGIASNINNNNTNNNNNDINYSVNSKKFLNNYQDNEKNYLSPLLNVDLSKTSYADKNRINFTKNMKNLMKFNNNQWFLPKINNNNNNKTNNNNYGDIKKKKNFNENPLYQMSHDIINSLPGINSYEFFAFPSRIPRRALQIEVVHLKDLKVSASSSSTAATTTTTDTNDLNDGSNNEPGNSSSSTSQQQQQIDMNGSDISIINSTTHVQKIGQTSISRENDSKASFGTIIKNTYSASSREAKNFKTKIEEKKYFVSDAMKNNSNVKIIACTTQQQQQQSPQTNEASSTKVNVVNKNQTLINMLTQQVMMPTNTNRHYIITSANKSNENSNILTAGTSGSQILRRTTASGQSQLVQILNSPPSNFTMKTINTITSSASTATKTTNQIVTSSPSTANSSAASSSSSTSTTAELPNSVKQQGIVQFICKTDGKIIHLTPICNASGSGGGMTKKITYKVDTSGAKSSSIPTILHHANQQIILNNQLRKGENPNILTIIQKQSNVDGDKKNKLISQATTSSPMSTRSIYEETYAKFIQTPSGTSNAADMGLLTISSSPINNSTLTPTSGGTFIQKIGKTVIQSSNQILPKFNQAFGKSIFSSTLTSSNDSTLHYQQQQAQVKKVIANNTRTIVSAISPTSVKNEIKTETSSSILNLIDNENVVHEKQQHPTLQSALQGNNLLYARSIGNGKIIASSNNNVLLTALRSGGNNTNQSATSNLRIITTMSESPSTSNRATIMTPVRISVPIQIPQLINSVRPQSNSPAGNFRHQQIVIATTSPTMRQQNSIQANTSTTVSGHHQISTSKLESLLLTPQNQTNQQQQTIITAPKQEVEIDASTLKIKVEQKQQQQQSKKNVDNSTLEQLREFDMVLEQVLERSSVTPNSNSVSSPPRSERSSPRKHLSEKKCDTKSSSGSISPNDSPSSCKSLSGTSSCTKILPKLQEDEHTAQRILDILANYKEQVRNSPDLNNKPAPRRRANPPTNPPATKRKKVVSSTGSIKNSKQFGSSSDVMTDTMGSEEDSSCGMGSGVASTGSINNSPRGDIDEHTDVSMDNNFYVEDSKREIALSPQSSSSSVATSPAHNKFSLSRRLLLTTTAAATTTTTTSATCSESNSKNIESSSKGGIIITSNSSNVTRSSSISESIERLSAHGSTTAVLMPGNYILPMNVLKSGQQLAILSSNNGQKIIAVPANQLSAASSTVNPNNGGTSIILQRYVNQINEGVAATTSSISLSDKTVLTHSGNELESTTTTSTCDNNHLKSFRLQQSNTAVSLIANSKIVNNTSSMSSSSSNSSSSSSSSSASNQATTDAFYAAVKAAVGDSGGGNDGMIEVKQENDSNTSFVNEKTLITEIIQQQQQQFARNHPQQNFMIKLSEPSDSSIMFVSSNNSNNNNDVKIKSEEIDFDKVVVKEEIIDFSNENDLLNSPMLNTKMEVDENTSSNHAIDENKLQQYQTILSNCLAKQPSGSKQKNFLIDPTNKTLMYIERKQMPIDKEIFNPKSFSEECADLGVDEPIASDLFPEADLLFDSGSPKFDQLNPSTPPTQIKREIENGEILLQMNYNHNITEPWLNFDTEDELVDGESDDDNANSAARSSLQANF